MKKIMISAIFCSALLMIGGCARDISSSTYDAKTLGEAATTYLCTVIKVRTVSVEEGERLEDNRTGQMLGALAGGALGNTVGGGRGRTTATVAGALAGAAAGAYAEKSLKSQKAYEYVVELDGGHGLKTVVQGTDVVLNPGQRALLIVEKGRSRLAPY